MEHTKHLWRAGIILIAMVIGAVIFRNFLIPESFGMTGHYRYDSIGEYMDKEVRHLGSKSCSKCHRDKMEEKMAGRHAAVSCENCHGPNKFNATTFHAEGGEKVANMPVKGSYELCQLCHEQMSARPKDFPQVNIREHLRDQDIMVKENIPKKICFLCHSPHDPLSE